MWSANLVSESIVKQEASIYWRVDFTNGIETITKQYRFAIDSTLLSRKKIVKYDLDNFNATPDSLSPGAIDVSDVVDPTPTQPSVAELEFRAWQKDRADLKKIKELVAEGILPANSIQQTNLQNKVASDFKAAYFDLI